MKTHLNSYKKLALSLSTTWLLLQVSGCAQVEVIPEGEQVTLSSYTGAFQSQWNDNYNFFVIERDNKLYIQNVDGVIEIDINDKYAFEIEAFGVTAQFSDFENGKFQSYVGTDSSGDYGYKRINIDTNNNTFLYAQNGSYSDFSQIKRDACAADYVLKPLAKNSRHPEKISQLIKQIKSEKYAWGEQDSLLIYQDGQLIVEEYFNGYTRNDPHMLASVSKSITSLLVGSLVAEGKIADINQPMLTYLPQYEHLFKDGKEKISLANFMNMSSGIEWDRTTLPFTDPKNVFYQWQQSENRAKFTLSRDVQFKPGERFVYSNGSASAVGSVIETVTNQNVAEFALQSPLNELCFKNAFWKKNANKVTAVAGGAYMRPIDMLKIGQLMLDGGQWQGKQVFDKQWINDSFDKTLNPYNSQYGLFWWQNDAFVFENATLYPILRAEGWAGQEISIIKDLNLIVVNTANNPGYASKSNQMIREFIIPAFLD